jgi:hypothetical protein
VRLPPANALCASLVALAACSTDISWTVTSTAPCEGAEAATSYWGIVPGECSPLASAPVACGIDACPDASVGPGTSALLAPGEYCFWSLRVARDDDGTCRLLAEDHASRALPNERTEVALDGRCVPDTERELGVWDALVESLAGCNPRCDPERCECPGACTTGECAAVLTADRIGLARTHACIGQHGAHQLSCWGERSAFDHPGNPTAVPEPVDVLYNGSTGLRDLFVGTGVTCVTNQTMVVHCFGAGTSGWRLDAFGRVFVEDDRLLRATVLAIGGGFACAPELDELVCWGEGSERRLGAEADGVVGAGPVLAADEEWERPTQVAAGEAHACAITPAGRIYCWGRNTDGQVDPFATERGARLPVASRWNEESPPWEQVAAGGNNTCAIAGNTLFCWGEGTPVGLAFEDRGQWAVAGEGYTDVSVGTNRVCARSVNGAIYCFRPGELPQQVELRATSFVAGNAMVCTTSAGQRDVRCTSLGDDAPPPLLGHGHTSPTSNAVCP